METEKSFTITMPSNHRHAVVIDINIGFSLNISEFTGSTRIDLKVRALIDTGANRSCISRRIISACQLESISQMAVRSAQGVSEAKVYSVDIALPSDICFQNVPVMEFSGGSDFDAIIGMDILNCCDFAITNANSETVFTLRIPPSEQHLDFTK